MNKEKVLGIIRHILTFAGGFAVAKGIVDAEYSQEIIGAIVTVVGAIWSIKSKK